MSLLSFSHLGTYGWYGNQLFQIAATIGVATKNEMDYLFPTWKYDKYFKKSLPQMSKDELDKIKGDFINREGPHHFEDVIIPDNNKNWDLGGYLQSEKYWEHCRDLVLSYLELKDEYNEIIETKYSELLSLNTCALHVRRGDYLMFPAYHPVCGNDYYRQAISHFDNDTIFVIFSDDIEYCKRNFIGERFIIFDDGDKTRGGDIIIEHNVMARCKNIITANSSFSLWASILNNNPNKKIISPKNWFGPALAGHQLQDMYPNNTIII
jgi:hypothetical protein